MPKNLDEMQNFVTPKHKTWSEILIENYDFLSGTDLSFDCSNLAITSIKHSSNSDFGS